MRMIVLISEALLQRSSATEGQILRDRFLQGFCVRLNKRKRTFLIATSVRGSWYEVNQYCPARPLKMASPLGIPWCSVVIFLHSDVYKLLFTKLSWMVGVI